MPRSNRHLDLQWVRRVAVGVPFVLEEVHRRMVDRAQIMRPSEGGVVHQGWLHPGTLGALQGLYPERPLHVFSPKAVPLAQAPNDPAAARFLSKLVPLWRAGRGRSQEQDRSTALPTGQPLPLEGQSVGMVWSPLWLHAVEDPGVLLGEWLRVLKPGGALFFTCFGPDTAQEIRAVAQALGLPMADFADMHDLGDLMSRCGFSDPVMEMEKLTLTYTSPQALLSEWHSVVGNNLAQQPAGLMSRKRYTQALQQLEGLRQNATGRIPLTLELIYGHAWKVERPPKQPVATVKISDIGGRSGPKQG
ncbi:methyltransferase domain-containing protein [Limnobacter sp.]|uniref:methyltransferase domain-containing protein n=1 Tax=Limnobacter sp. TaxID=2003368 RepID=UPI00351530E6